MTKTFTLKTSSGDKTFKVGDLDFINIMCDLEEKGINVMDLLDDEKRADMQVFTVYRALFATLIDSQDLRECGKLLSQHVSNGGSLDIIMDAFTGAMKDAGFGKSTKGQAVTPAKTAAKKASAKVDEE